jgi:hypothetical protein
MLECMSTRSARCTLPDQTRHTRDLVSKIQGWVTKRSFVLLGLSPSYGLNRGPSDLCSIVYDSAIHICLLRSFVVCRPTIWFCCAWWWWWHRTLACRARRCRLRCSAHVRNQNPTGPAFCHMARTLQKFSSALNVLLSVPTP